MVLVYANETGVCSMDEEPKGGDTEAFSGVSAIQTRAGAVPFFESFLGDGLGWGSML